MASAYFNRRVAVHEDGTFKRYGHGDHQHEDAMRRAIEQRWGVDVHPFAELSFLDVWLERRGRVMGYGELKWREFAAAQRNSLWVGVRKWWRMYSMWAATGRPVWLFVRFTDRMLYIAASEIDPRQQRIVEARRKEQSRNDREPVVVIPIGRMKRLEVLP